MAQSKFWLVMLAIGLAFLVVFAGCSPEITPVTEKKDTFSVTIYTNYTSDVTDAVDAYNALTSSGATAAFEHLKPLGIFTASQIGKTKEYLLTLYTNMGAANTTQMSNAVDRAADQGCAIVFSAAGDNTNYTYYIVLE